MQRKNNKLMRRFSFCLEGRGADGGIKKKIKEEEGNDDKR